MPQLPKFPAKCVFAPPKSSCAGQRGAVGYQGATESTVLKGWSGVCGMFWGRKYKNKPLDALPVQLAPPTLKATKTGDSYSLSWTTKEMTLSIAYTFQVQYKSEDVSWEVRAWGGSQSWGGREHPGESSSGT